MKHHNESTISIIIPAYNEEHYIGACLKQIIQHSDWLVHEVIVIDNASTDKTADIAQTFPWVKVIKEEKKWLTQARQRGYLESTGDILAYLDADTKMKSQWIQKVQQAFQQDKQLVFLSGPYDYYDLPRWKQVGLWIYWRLLAYPTYLATWYLGVGGNMVMTRKMLDNIGGFDTSIEFYGEDTNIARRAYSVGHCKFMLSLVMPSSARRLNHQGALTTAYIYCVNFLHEAIFHKPYTHSYKDFR